MLSAAERSQLEGLYYSQRFAELEIRARLLLEQNPESGFIWNVLGLSLQMQGKDGVAALHKATTLLPDDADMHCKLGNALSDVGRKDEAVASYRNALQIKPDYAEIHSNLGLTLHDMGQFAEAEACYQRALEIKPDYAEAYSNLGFTLKEVGRLGEAETSCRRALEIIPDFADAYGNLGNILKEMGRPNEAVASFRQAIQINPDIAGTHCSLGITLQSIGRLVEAEESFRRALEIRPDYAEAHSSLIFTMDLMAGHDTASLQAERKRWDAAQAAHLHQRRAHANIPNPARRLRVGYVSGDFWNHSAVNVFGGMLTQYDRSQFDVYAYSNSKRKDDRFTDLFRQSVTAWRNITGLSDDAAADMIRDDQIDILVDLSGHTAGNRLLVFARKPAPIQITAWGYATSTGMRAMDVFFADPVVVPPEERHYFTEEVRYLPSVVGAFFNEPFPDVAELPALSNDFITFGSLNRLAKVSDDAFRAWAQVLLAVSKSRLFLKTPELDDPSNRERVSRHFMEVGITAERIILQGATPWGEHMQAYNQIDIALDPFPHGGGVTALEGMMMGVPAIILRWPTTVGRTSASLMTALGLKDWVAQTQEQYVALAAEKAGDLQSLAALRQQMRGVFTASVMGDPVAYARAVEQEYRQLWREWCARRRVG